MQDAFQPFDVAQTHGLLVRKGLSVTASSDARGWRSLYASTQREEAFESHCAAVEDHLVVLHLDGPVTIERALEARTETTVIPPGGMHLIPGGTDFRVRLRGTLSTLHLYVRRSVLEEVAAECMPGDPRAVALLPRFGEADPMLERLLQGVGDALYDDHPATACYVDHLARAIAARLIRRHSTAAGAMLVEPARANVPSGEMARIIAFMRDNLHRSIDLADIAATTPYTPSHFARRFRQATGAPPHHYLIGLRVERASHLLAETRKPIVAIALDCGFASQEHLTRHFRRAVGTTPAAYRLARRS